MVRDGWLLGWLRRTERAVACTASALGDTLAPFCPFWGAVGEAVRRMMGLFGGWLRCPSS